MAFDPLIILTGDFKLGATSYKDDVASVEIVRSRDTVEIPATFGTGRKEQRAGAVAQEVRINMINDVQATSLWAELWDAIDDPDGELAFEAVFKAGAVSATNPKFTGTLIVTGANVGGESGTVSMNQLTFPVKGTVTQSTSP